MQSTTFVQVCASHVDIALRQLSLGSVEYPCEGYDGNCLLGSRNVFIVLVLGTSIIDGPPIDFLIIHISDIYHR